MTDESKTGVQRFSGWAVLELMGHRQRAGFVEDVEMFGTRLCRIDVKLKLPEGVNVGGETETTTTEYYGGPAIYGLHPCDEATARKVAGMTTSSNPIHPYTQRAAIAHHKQEQFDYHGGEQDGED